MSSFYAELQVAGHTYPLKHCAYEFTQATDARGRVIAKVRHGLVRLTLDVPEDDFLTDWATTAYRPLAGSVVFFETKGRAARETLSWEAGNAVSYFEDFLAGNLSAGAYVCHLIIAAPKLVITPGSPPLPFAAPTSRDYAYVPPALVGPSAAPLSKQQRYDARMKKLDAARAQLADSASPAASDPLVAAADATHVAPNGVALRQAQDRQRLQAATERLTRNNVAVERAKLADDSYENDSVMGLSIRPKKTPLPEGWKVDRVIKNQDSGFMAVVYESDFERPRRKVVAFRGTDADPKLPEELKKDGATDALQGMGFYTDAYKQAELTARKLRQEFPKGFDITGHSLGGGQASQAGLVTGFDTYTFNSAGLHQNSIARAGITPEVLARNKQKIQAYYSDQDPLSAYQDNSGITKAVLKKALPPYFTPGLPSPLDPLLDDPRSLPQAIGVRHKLKDGGGHWSPAIIDGAGHSVPPMVAAIEKQKDEDLATIGHLVPAAR